MIKQELKKKICSSKNTFVPNVTTKYSKHKVIIVGLLLIN